MNLANQNIESIFLFSGVASLTILACYAIIMHYIIIHVCSAFSLVASCVLLKYTRTDDVNGWRANFIII